MLNLGENGVKGLSFLLQYVLETGQVVLDVAARLIDVMQNLHVQMRETDIVVDVLLVTGNELLLALQDLLNKVVMLLLKHDKLTGIAVQFHGLQEPVVIEVVLLLHDLRVVKTRLKKLRVVQKLRRIVLCLAS